MRTFDQHGLEYGPRYVAGPCEGITQGIVGQSNLARIDPPEWAAHRQARSLTPRQRGGAPSGSAPGSTSVPVGAACARGAPATYLPHASREVSPHRAVAAASIARVARAESRQCNTCGDSARVHVSLAVIAKVWLVECGP